MRLWVLNRKSSACFCFQAYKIVVPVKEFSTNSKRCTIFFIFSVSTTFSFFKDKIILVSESIFFLFLDLFDFEIFCSLCSCLVAELQGT